MKKFNSRNWIFAVATADDDDLNFGPYTESRAEALAARFNERIDPMGLDAGYVHATAYPIQNYGITALLAQFGQ